MKVYLVNCSPREKSCTYTALCEVKKGLEEFGIDTEIFWLGNKPIADCIDCGSCFKTKAGCVFQDAVNAFAALAKDADGFVFGSPVYYASASGALTSFLDRLFFSNGAALSGKPAAAVVSCRRSGGSAALDRINKYFTINRMPIASSSYWNIVHGNTPDEVRQDLEGMQIMRNLGRSLGFMVKAYAMAKAEGLEQTYETGAHTNFIR